MHTEDQSRAMLNTCCDGADDFYAMYQQGFYVNCNRETHEFYWDHENYRTIMSLSVETQKNASRMLKKISSKHSFGFSFNARSNELLDLLQSPQIKPESWLTPKIRSIYCEMLRSGYAFTVEVVGPERQLLGGMFGISLNEVLTLDTMCGTQEHRWASKAALCKTLLTCADIGISLVDVEIRHPPEHPCQQIGEGDIPFIEFRQRLHRQGLGGPGRFMSAASFFR